MHPRFVVLALALTLCAAATAADIPKLLEQAKSGDAVAQYWLSVAYARGDGVPRDMSETFRWAKASAEQGNIDAQRNLGFIFSKLGPPEIRNPQEALKWFMRAAEGGDAESQYNAGLALMNGDGAAANPKAAVDLWEKAAAQGYPEAECYLGVSYLEGVGVEQNLERARELFKKAAMHAMPVAQYNLAVMYWQGAGGDMNKAESLAWMSMANDSGNSGAKKYLDLMPSKMTSEEVADGMLRKSAIKREIKAAK